MNKFFSEHPHQNRKNEFLNQYGIMLTIALTVLIQSFTIVWWASSLSTRVNALEDWIKENRSMPTMIHRLDERFDHLKNLVERVVKHIESEKGHA
ncbi:MAG: hypothetical protein Q8S31_10650 [Alphaproteobacteria bacterium]|nr:hypothetical protein [Alphaproteobacteria bacterium]